MTILSQLLLGAGAIAGTVVVHAGFMAAAMSVGPPPQRPGSAHRGLAKALQIVAVVLWFFLAICVQCWMWAALLRLLGAFPELEEALYFAIVTYTTLGYGDIVLGPEWRLLGACAAANGTIIIGWTTAMVFLAVQRVYGRRP